jgi:hypothetical protein
VGRWRRPSLVVEVGGRAAADSGWRCSEAPRPQEIGGLQADRWAAGKTGGEGGAKGGGAAADHGQTHGGM